MKIITKKEYQKAVKVVQAYHSQITAEYEYVKKQSEKLPNIHMDENTKMNDLDISVRLYNNLHSMIRKHQGYGRDWKNPEAQYITPGEMTIKEIRDLINYKDFSNQRNCGKKAWEEYLKLISFCGLGKEK